MINEQYEFMNNRMKELELSFDKDNLTSLFGMIDLYGELQDTTFHDLSNAIELWIDQYSNTEVLEYIHRKNDSYYNNLVH
ncbi:hypothetical protein [Isobaculum melis]|uniref:Uncharacterized protein n=1 Tax=Isobaculum melis TaxID=142588 RepID=A0A1H9PXW8_9LACT|nr:hypothetical protein [Isobaculum melis]SER52990.1 hypothetical protein SAMN04488559_101219 [Isobaculum melis]